MNRLVWALSVWGTVQIIAGSKFFAPLRDRFPAADEGEKIRTVAKFFGTLITCPMCLGWWLGSLMHVLGMGLWANAFGWRVLMLPGTGIVPWLIPSSWVGDLFGLFVMVLDGAAASALCEGARILSERLERK
jgi:hypothetical protein